MVLLVIDDKYFTLVWFCGCLGIEYEEFSHTWSSWWLLLSVGAGVTFMMECIVTVQNSFGRVVS